MIQLGVTCTCHAHVLPLCTAKSRARRITLIRPPKILIRTATFLSLHRRATRRRPASEKNVEPLRRHPSAPRAARLPLLRLDHVRDSPVEWGATAASFRHGARRPRPQGWPAKATFQCPASPIIRARVRLDLQRVLIERDLLCALLVSVPPMRRSQTRSDRAMRHPRRRGRPTLPLPTATGADKVFDPCIRYPRGDVGAQQCVLHAPSF